MKVTKQKDHLMTLIKSMHEGVKFPCEQCDYKATQKGKLVIHITLIHADKAVKDRDLKKKNED